MDEMGSGEKSEIGCHILAHLALHRHFVREKRPVPRFLFLDQPTQVYYPPERDADGRLDTLNDEDRTAVHRLFAVIFRLVRKVAPDLQVIITDHADLDDLDFQTALVERWRGGKHWFLRAGFWPILPLNEPMHLRGRSRRSYSFSNPWLVNFRVRPFSVTVRTT